MTALCFTRWRDVVYRNDRISAMDTSILAHGTLPMLSSQGAKRIACIGNEFKFQMIAMASIPNTHRPLLSEQPIASFAQSWARWTLCVC
jgi:hypothetical protein